MCRLISFMIVCGVSLSATAQTKLEQDFGLSSPSNTVATNTVATAEILKVDWSGFPIEMRLGVGQERYITFFDQIKSVALKPEIQNAADLLVYEVYGNNLMLRLNEDISTRIKVVMANGIIVPIDLMIDTSGKHHASIQLQAPDTREVIEKRRVYQLNTRRSGKGNDSNTTAVDAIRYAFQRFYSPERLQEGLRALEPSELATFSKTPKLYRTGRVSIKPMISWSYNGLFVTACQVKNRFNTSIALDPRLIRGQFRMGAFYQQELRPHGDAQDETILVLVSDKPFSDAAGVWGG